MPHAYDTDESERPSEAVIAAVADATDRSPLELPPLARTIDPDALDSICRRSGTGRSSVTVSFEYSGREVTVRPDEVRVE